MTDEPTVHPRGHRPMLVADRLGNNAALSIWHVHPTAAGPSAKLAAVRRGLGGPERCITNCICITYSNRMEVSRLVRRLQLVFQLPVRFVPWVGYQPAGRDGIDSQRVRTRRVNNMAVKQLAYEQEARQALWSGVEKLAGAVKATLGPRGRNAVTDTGWGGTGDTT